MMYDMMTSPAHSHVAVHSINPEGVAAGLVQVLNINMNVKHYGAVWMLPPFPVAAAAVCATKWSQLSPAARRLVWLAGAWLPASTALEE